MNNTSMTCVLIIYYTVAPQNTNVSKKITCLQKGRIEQTLMETRKNTTTGNLSFSKRRGKGVLMRNVKTNAYRYHMIVIILIMILCAVTLSLVYTIERSFSISNKGNESNNEISKTDQNETEDRTTVLTTSGITSLLDDGYLDNLINTKAQKLMTTSGVTAYIETVDFDKLTEADIDLLENYSKPVPSLEELLINKLKEPNTESFFQYTTTHVNVRSEPSTDAEILRTTNINEYIEICSIIDGWAVIKESDGNIAYMYTEWFSDSPIQINSYTDDELYILSHVIAGEAQNCDDNEQQLVGSIVLNRVNHYRYPNSIREVVFQPGQYTCTIDGNYYKTPTEANIRNAKYLLEYGSILPENVLYQSKSALGSGVYLQTRWHKYCYQ
jgi:N-acetylmuramoyl-L-alanine amidase